MHVCFYVQDIIIIIIKICGQERCLYSTTAMKPLTTKALWLHNKGESTKKKFPLFGHCRVGGL